MRRNPPSTYVLISAVAAAVLGVLPGSAAGAGATYEVLQCHVNNRGTADVIVREANPYTVIRACDRGDLDNSMQVNSRSRADGGKSGSFTWDAPPGTGFVGVQVGAKLRRDSGHVARIYTADAQGRETRRVASGGSDGTSFQTKSWQGSQEEQLVAALICNSGSCPQSNQAKTWIRNVRMTLADYGDPVVSPSGNLLVSSWQRGVRTLGASFSDSGSGLSKAWVRVNGLALRDLALGCSRVPGSGRATQLQPCGLLGQLDPLAPSTAAAPFKDGANSLVICAADFAGNQTCNTRTIRIDNTAPSLGFANEQSADDPELIRAPVSDAHSGVAGGRILYRPVGDTIWKELPTERIGSELRARVDSSAEPPGDYEFLAESTDVAGNRRQTTAKQNGVAMVLSFPLRAGVDLRARIEPGGQRRVRLPYGRESKAAGRLLTADGSPLRGKEVRVEEYFGEGALIDRRVRTVVTDDSGRWRSKLPAGPSRTVKAHFDGDRRYRDEKARVGGLAVRTRAGFEVSRRAVQEGRSVVFRGRVGRLGARIPNGGKLLELQVQERPGRWNTVREAFRTRSNGRYKLRYRFGRFYSYDTRFKFRVKVTRESDWPYVAPVSTKARKVTVRAR